MKPFDCEGESTHNQHHWSLYQIIDFFFLIANNVL